MRPGKQWMELALGLSAALSRTPATQRSGVEGDPGPSARLAAKRRRISPFAEVSSGRGSSGRFASRCRCGDALLLGDEGLRLDGVEHGVGLDLVVEHRDQGLVHVLVAALAEADRLVEPAGAAPQ